MNNFNIDTFVKNIYKTVTVKGKVRLEVPPNATSKCELLFLFSPFVSSLGNIDDVTRSEFLLPAITDNREAVFAAMYLGEVISEHMVINKSKSLFIGVLKNDNTVAITVGFAPQESEEDVICEQITKVRLEESLEDVFQNLSI